MGATPIWRISISKQNKDVQDITDEWTENGDREASDKACKAIREYYKKEQHKKQLMNGNMGGPAAADGNPNEQFIQTAEFENGIASPLDNIPIAKLHEQDLTEMELSPLNEEQAVALVNKIRASKDKIIENERFVIGFFGVVDVKDKRTGEQVPTIQNTEYERKRKAEEQEALEKLRQKREIELAEKQKEEERLFTIEREADSHKSFDQLQKDIYHLIVVEDVANDRSRLNENPTDRAKAARKLNMTVGEIDKLYHNCNGHLYKINDMIRERIDYSDGYWTLLRKEKSGKEMKENKLYSVCN